ncbi:hypothetical protein HK104_010833 [Borealophlyctis nickersoniae]|nr:hypothetical protein HK104_010833 [Borealophlyctis nickersoniae]
MYESCDQTVKDFINSILAKVVLKVSNDTNDLIVTLDDSLNGTCETFFKAGYNGHYVAVQRDRQVALLQKENWLKHHIQHEYQFLVHVGDIRKHFIESFKFWCHPRTPSLVNFDFMGTFFSETSDMARLLLERPDITIGKDATFIVVTFQAIADSRLLLNLRNSRQWRKKFLLYQRMKNWSRERVAKYYLEQFGELFIKKKPSCVSILPVEIDPNGKSTKSYTFTVVENGVVYGGRRKCDSTMMFTLWRLTHNGDCQHDHTKPCFQEPVVGEKRKRVTETEELIDFEENVTLNEDFDSFDMDMERNESDTENMDLDASETELTDIEYDTETAFSSELMEEDMISVPCDDPTTLEDLSSLQMLPHQIKMVQAVLNENITRGIIEAICGSGKSLPMTVICKSVTLSIIFVPFKILVEQFYQQYFAHDPSVIAIRVNSDHVDDIILPEIGEKNIVFIANFDSVHRIAQLGLNFDIVNWDEGHLATSDKQKKIYNKQDDTNEADADNQVEHIDAAKVAIVAKKHIFWTATPNRKMKDHQELYGDIIFSYPFDEAVADKVIKLFGIYLSCYKEDFFEGETSKEEQYRKIVELSGEFIKNEKCKRILIYVNQVTDRNALLSVDHMRKTRNMFDSSWKMDFISGETKPERRKDIFRKFCKEDDTVHIIVSCRTISVGIDLPNCDAVIFADTTRNVQEIIQRGCRPCRLTKTERETGKITNAKIFIPIDVSGPEFSNTCEEIEKSDAKYHSKIRGQPLEIPMLVLDLLKKHLEIDFEFTRNGKFGMNDQESDEESDEENEENDDEKGYKGNVKKEKIAVNINFPYSEYLWDQSDEDFAKTMDNVCAKLVRRDVIPGWDNWTPVERSQYMANWSRANDGRKPRLIQVQKKNPASAEETKMGLYIRMLSRKGYDHCIGSDFDPLQEFDWWKEIIAKLTREKMEWEENTSDKWRAKYIADWSRTNGGRKPRKKDNKKDPPSEEEKKMGRYLIVLRRKGYDHCIGSDFDPLKEFKWWQKFLANFFVTREKTKWEENTSDKDRAIYIAEWSRQHSGRRPLLKSKNKDKEEEKLGRYINKLMNEGHSYCKKPCFDPLKEFKWSKNILANFTREEGGVGRKHVR